LWSYFFDQGHGRLGWWHVCLMHCGFSRSPALAVSGRIVHCGIITLCHFRDCEALLIASQTLYAVL